MRSGINYGLDSFGDSLHGRDFVDPSTAGANADDTSISALMGNISFYQRRTGSSNDAVGPAQAQMHSVAPARQAVSGNTGAARASKPRIATAYVTPLSTCSLVVCGRRRRPNMASRDQRRVMRVIRSLEDRPARSSGGAARTAAFARLGNSICLSASSTQAASEYRRIPASTVKFLPGGPRSSRRATSLAAAPDDRRRAIRLSINDRSIRGSIVALPGKGEREARRNRVTPYLQRGGS